MVAFDIYVYFTLGIIDLYSFTHTRIDVML